MRVRAASDGGGDGDRSIDRLNTQRNALVCVCNANGFSDVLGTHPRRANNNYPAGNDGIRLSKTSSYSVYVYIIPQVRATDKRNSNGFSEACENPLKRLCVCVFFPSTVWSETECYYGQISVR